eukprot:TRINITY_DN15578_c0_g1_i1.p1 TRINITY_DN15578_c0_g1~~TRINITY_DN15578_c0_g1_i1.p1  ORF type:complete len:800 (-),score=149.46 TRINITY_DN15578_c0_g1_i1:253-2652(-)
MLARGPLTASGRNLPYQPLLSGRRSTREPSKQSVPGAFPTPRSSPTPRSVKEAAVALATSAAGADVAADASAGLGQVAAAAPSACKSDAPRVLPAVSEHERLAEDCVCGNIFEENAKFCRKCGKRRPHRWTTAVPDAPDQGESKRHLRTALLHLITVSGLSKTAACLREEAGLEDDENDGILADQDRQAKTTGLMSLVRTSMEKRHQAVSQQHAVHKDRVGLLSGKMGSHQRRLGTLHERLRSLRGSLDEGPSLSHEELKASAARQHDHRMKISRRRAEAADLRRKLRDLQAVVESRRKRFDEAQAEVDLLRLHPTGAATARPTSTAAGPKVETSRGSKDDLFSRIDTDGDGVISPGEMERGVAILSAEARKLKGVLLGWDNPGASRKLVEQKFREVDTNGTGQLAWRTGQIKAFMRMVFSSHSLAMPEWDDQVWLNFFLGVDSDRSNTLSITEAIVFAKQCLEAALLSLLRIPEVVKAYDSHPVATAESWARSYMPAPLVKTSVLSYRSGRLTVNLAELASMLSPCAQANARHRQRMIKVVDAGSHVRQAVQLYQLCDKDGNGVLTWYGGEIRDFVTSVFRHYTLVPPAEDQIYRLQQRFDVDGSNSLDCRECVELCDALLRGVFYMEASKALAASLQQQASQPTLQPQLPTYAYQPQATQGTAVRRASSPVHSVTVAAPSPSPGYPQAHVATHVGVMMAGGAVSPMPMIGHMPPSPQLATRRVLSPNSPVQRARSPGEPLMVPAGIASIVSSPRHPGQDAAAAAAAAAVAAAAQGPMPRMLNSGSSGSLPTVRRFAT